MFKWLLEWGEEVKDRFQAVVPGYFGGGGKSSGWISGGATGLILAESGGLAAGIYEVNFYAYCPNFDDTIIYTCDHRNAKNDASLFTTLWILTASSQPMLTWPLYKIREGESFRITLSNVTTKAICGSLIWVRRFPLKRGQ